MLAEWAVECGEDDPVLVVPWNDPAGSAHFIDLRENPYDLGQVAEAEQHPALLHALRALNGGRSPVFTAKCDAWPMDAEEVAALQLNLDLNLKLDLNLDTDVGVNAGFDSGPNVGSKAGPGACASGSDNPCGFASYVDLIWRERAIFVSFHQQEQRLMRLVRLLEPLELPYAAAECVLRPSLVDLAGPQEGFAASLYIRSLGTDPAHAYEHWSAALAAATGVVRGREFSLA